MINCLCVADGNRFLASCNLKYIQDVYVLHLKIIQLISRGNFYNGFCEFLKYMLTEWWL